MKKALVAGVVFGFLVGCASRMVPAARTFEAYPLAAEDALVLGTAMQCLGQWVSEWDLRTYLVISDSPVPPSFPRSTTQAARDRIILDRLDRGETVGPTETVSTPWDIPERGKALDIVDGPVIPADLVASTLDRSSALKHLPHPQTVDEVMLVDAHFVDRLFKPDIGRGWRRFRKTFPGSFALVRFSAPGYDADHTTAIVSLSVTRGALNGIGAFVMLSKQGNWRVQWSKGLWVS